MALFPKLRALADSRKLPLLAKVVIRAPARISNFAEYFLDLSSLAPSGLSLYRMRDGNMFYARRGSLDSFVIAEIALLGEYSSPGMDVCPTDTVVDIGAHTGVFSVIAARKASKGRVIAVEPDPKNFQVLQRNLQLNNLENVVPVQAAVWRDGRCRLTQIGDYNNNSTLHPDALVAEGAGAGSRRVRLSEWMDRHHLANQSVSVQSVSLLSLIRRYRLKRIDLLKIDCEGSEYDILWNAPASALNRMRRIAMECHTFRGRRTPGRMACFLRKAGFDVRVQSDGPNDLNPIIFALRPNARAGRWRAKRPPAKYF